MDLWIADSREIGAVPRSAAALLDENDRRELALRGPADARHFLLGRIMLRLALSRRTGRYPSGWRFATSDLGRPVLADGCADLDFSISHSGETVAVAVSDGRVGLDVERYGVDPGAASCCLAAEELARFREMPEEPRRREFTALWTAKEAYAKLQGFGMNRELSEVTADEISRSTHAGSFSLPGAGRCQVTVLSARGSGPAPTLGVHFLRAGSLALVGAVSARTVWVPSRQAAGAQAS